MNRSALHRVIQTLLNNEPADDWLTATPHIKEERRRVDQYLSSPKSHAYGFTTLLGHLDEHEMTDNMQAVILESHLIQPAWQAPSELRQLLLACKLEQLHHGGSGIHGDSYRSLLKAVGSPNRPLHGNWTASYGAGDVIPAAWLLQDLREIEGNGLLQHSGDLISIINGHFVSTAFAFATSAMLAHQIGAFLEEWLPFCYQLENSAPEPLNDLVGQISPSYLAATSQPPISLRDPAPVLTSIVRTIDRLGESIEQRLQSSSANPLWTISKNETHPHSQSSFLDFNLSFDLVAAVELLGLVGGLWQRLIEHVCNEIGKHNSTTAPVQPPKAAQVVVDRMTLAGNAPRRFTGQDSQGIEDVRDRSLQLTMAIHSQLAELQNLGQIWYQVTSTHNWHVPSSEVPFGHRLFEILLGSQQSNFSTANTEQLLETLQRAASGLIGGKQPVHYVS